MENKKKINRYTLIGLSVAAVMVITVSLILPGIYILDDDMTIQSILSGTYLRPFGFTYYLSGELGIILSILYRIVPALPWFGLFQLFVYIISMGLVLSRVLEICGQNKKKIFIAVCCGIFIFLGFLSAGVMMIHYTVTAAVSAACGMFLLVTSKEKKQLIWPVILFLLTYLIRENVFFMSLPFIAIAFLTILINEKKEGFKRYGVPILIFAVSFAILFLINRILPLGEEWDKYKDYNELRTDVYDYTGIWPDDETAVSYYEQNGIDKTTVELYKSYDVISYFISGENSKNLLDESAKVLGVLAGYDETKTGDISMVKRAKDAIYTYVYFMLRYETMRDYHKFLIAAYIMFVTVAFMTSRKRMIFIPVLLFAARSFLWCYLAFAGRYPDRVLISSLIMEFMILLSVMTTMISKPEEFKYKTVVAGIMTAVFAIIGIISLCDNVNYYEAEKQRITADDDLYTYISENRDKTFILDVYSVVNHSIYAIKNYDHSSENYMLCGGWLTGHPLMIEKTESLNDDIYFAVKKEYENIPELIEVTGGISLVPYDDVSGKYMIYKIER